ncbi:zf-HC2 domain-containing protein [Hydrogenibacillus sp. N12]|uniref:zf-HC2 domain-containing protein n=1 Tax=Hydrogenibacillus sp. N12 TaxID=2866627 RepID=UPI001C7D3732|nr:zf-HC2 domain-containing protein [Hydrogenibacillus sp. N12]QZA33403.1 zf-HC2 domain-containing protein [Hydrogenibacillus sp. N12]
MRDRGAFFVFPAPGACPPEERWVDWALGRLGPEEAAALERHAAGCPVCAERRSAWAALAAALPEAARVAYAGIDPGVRQVEAGATPEDRAGTADGPPGAGDHLPPIGTPGSTGPDGSVRPVGTDGTAGSADPAIARRLRRLSRRLRRELLRLRLGVAVRQAVVWLGGAALVVAGAWHQIGPSLAVQTAPTATAWPPVVADAGWGHADREIAARAPAIGAAAGFSEAEAPLEGAEARRPPSGGTSARSAAFVAFGTGFGDGTPSGAEAAEAIARRAGGFGRPAAEAAASGCAGPAAVVFVSDPGRRFHPAEDGEGPVAVVVFCLEEVGNDMGELPEPGRPARPFGGGR